MVIIAIPPSYRLSVSIKVALLSKTYIYIGVITEIRDIKT